MGVLHVAVVLIDVAPLLSAPPRLISRVTVWFQASIPSLALAGAIVYRVLILRSMFTSRGIHNVQIAPGLNHICIQPCPLQARTAGSSSDGGSHLIGDDARVSTQEEQKYRQLHRVNLGVNRVSGGLSICQGSTAAIDVRAKIRLARLLN